MEEYTKMSELAQTELKDPQTVKILICYLLYRLHKPIDPEQLYDIAVSTEIINYFYYQDAISFLIENGSVSKEEKDGGTVYVLTKKGVNCAESLGSMVPKSYRDRIVTAALRYFAKLKYESEIKIEYIKLENGYYVRCRCLDVREDLMDLKLYAPDLEQAELIGKNIMKNPVGLYSKILELALNNKEEEFDPDDL